MATHEDQQQRQQQQRNMSMSCLSMDAGYKERPRRGNRRGSSSRQKKKPQRGMGVEQLERLRLQERWNKMNEMSALQYQYYANQFHLPDQPIPSVPVMHGPGHYGVPSVAVGGLVSLEPGLVYPRHGNGSGGGCGSGHALMDPYRVGGGLSLDETSKELSSIPKLQQQQWPLVPDRCDFCFKKKRFNDEDNTGFNGDERDNYGELSHVNNGYDIHGLKQENNIDFYGGIKGFDARAARSAFYAGHHNLNKDLKVVAVHRNGNTSMGKNVLMEYEFFPADKDGRSTCSKELGLPAEASVAVVGGEASYITNSAYNNNVKAASNSVDLSLKLSY